MLSVHDIILIMLWDIFLMAFHCTKANHIYDRQEYDKNTVRNDVKCRHFTAYYVIGGSMVYIGSARLE